MMHRSCLTRAALLISSAGLAACGGSSLPLEGKGGNGGMSSSGGSMNAGAGGGSGGLGAPPRVTSPFSADEIEGEPYGVLGNDAAFVGDLDGDGYDDFVVVDGGSALPRVVADGTWGAVYGFYGRPGFPPYFNAADADFILDGIGNAVAGLGDFDGDGYDDFAFVQECDPLMTTCVPTNGLHVVFGGATRLAGDHRSDEVGVTWFAPRADARYVNVRAAGDVNGDGLADLLADTGVLNWMERDTPEPVSSHLLLGRRDRGALANSAPDASFEGQSGQYGVNFGSTGVGDVDGDGFDDLVISTLIAIPSPPLALSDFTGTVNLFYGAADRFHGSIKPGDADATFPWISYFVSLKRQGDLDGDGYADLAVPTLDSQRHAELHIVYGQAARFSGAYADDAADLLVTTPGQFAGIATGDVNGDGRIDLVVGDSDANQGAGWLAFLPGVAGRRRGTYAISDADVVLYGQSRPEQALGDFTELDVLGNGVGTGDVNGDGIDEVIVGAQSNIGGDVWGGRAFLVFGSAK